MGRMTGFLAGMVSWSLLLAVACLGAGCSHRKAPEESPGRQQSAVLGQCTEAPIAVSAGAFHTCALLADQTVECWGINEDGELGNGTTTGSTTPVAVSGLRGVTQISTGGYHTCALLSGGTVQCWGYNADGELGNGNTISSTTPTPVGTPPLQGVTQIAAGGFHACASLSDNTVWCWGYNANGELGDTGTTDSSTPVAVSNLSDLPAGGIVQISSSAIGAHTCVLLGDESVRCWGRGTEGQLGTGLGVNSVTPVAIPGLAGIIQISPGGSHTCALMSDRTVQCWGTNGDGQLGDRTTTDHPTPVAVTGLGGVTQLSGGDSHSCARLSSGGVVCWGINSRYELGNGSTIDSATPVTVQGLSGGATQISAGLAHTCALRSDGSVTCWGDNEIGQLGNGQMTDSPTPVAVTDVSGVVQISSGLLHSCALLSDGTAKCWGDNNDGQLGNGTETAAANPTPAEVSGLQGVVQLSGKGVHNCALLAGGAVKCWGYNAAGELGDGSRTDQTIPVNGPSFSTAVAELSSGFRHSCVLLSDNSIRCWGLNFYGELGNGGFTDSITPVAVPSLGNNVAQVFTGYFRTCALMSGGTVECWGFNGTGELGNGTTGVSDVPVPVVNLGGVTQVSLGNHHTCAVLSDGTVQCWGQNFYGQLGNGGTADSLIPVAVSGLVGVTQMSSGAFHNCALLIDGTVACWGTGFLGELGGEMRLTSPVPIPVDNLAGVTALAAGRDHTCALLSGGTVKCWGDNSSGQLGDGISPGSPAPVTVVCDNVSGAVNGQPCAGAGTCASGFCVDGVCCAGSCGGGDPNDCQSCATGGAANGTCATLPPSHVCRPRAGVCDTPETCTGVSATCPADAFVAANAICDPATNLCESPGVCSGAGPVCSARTPLPLGTCTSVPTGHPAVDLDGGTATVGGITLTFAGGVSSAGQIAVVDSGAGCPPPTGFQLLPNVPPPRYWNIDTTAGYTPPITICIHYAPSWVQGSEDNLRIVHGNSVPDPATCNLAQAGWASITTSVCRSNACLAGKTPCQPCSPKAVVCGTTSSLSPFALVEPLPNAVPVVSVPGRLVAEATGAGGAVVSFNAPATDSEDGPLTPTCTPGSGSTFALGTTTVACTATDANGLMGSGSFTVTVRDATGPTWSGVPTIINAFATGTNGAKVSYVLPKATDAVDGARTVTCTPASGSQFPVNKTTVTCKASDTRANQSTATFAVWVTYQAPTDGTFFLFPIRPNGTSIFRVGRPVPARFKLTGASGGITNLVAKLVVTKISSAIQGTSEDTSDETVADTDLIFKYRPLLKWYAYRWKTTGQTQGTYQLKADLGDGVSHQIHVSLRAAL